MSLEINSKQDRPDRHVLELSGRLDTQTTPQLDEILDPVLEGGTKTIVFDLEGLEYISSAGLRAIFKAKKVLATRDGSVLVVNLQPTVKKVFDIVKALPVSSVFASWAEMDKYLDKMQKKVLDGED